MGIIPIGMKFHSICFTPKQRNTRHSGHKIPVVVCVLFRIVNYFLVAVTDVSVEGDDRCNRLEARSCGLPEAAFVSTPEVPSISSIARFRPTIIVLLVLPVLLLLFRMRLAFICLRGDGEEFFLLRACFRLLEVECAVDVEVVEEEEERLMDAEEETRLMFGILRGRISL